MSSFVNIVASGFLAVTAVVATANPVSYQDVATLTNTRTAEHNRWLSYLVSVPIGSEHSQIQNGENEYSVRKIEHVVGVHTTEALHVLDRRHIMESGEPVQINRELKGDRVFTPKTPNAVVASYNLTNPSTLVTGSIGKKAAKKNLRLAKAQTFDKLSSTQISDEKVSLAPRYAIKTVSRPTMAKGQLRQARAAARAMAKVADQVRREEISVASNSTANGNVSAYAPQTSPMASAFAAVLRPTLRKEEKKKAEKSDSVQNSLKEAVSELGKSARRTKVKLGRGDHKWAANALPRSTYSRSQRRCLASGIYFEARSEPIKGQQAVAQVILNRVKNPTYPNTICGVVYQNKWRRNACQFSFACDGKRDRVNSKKHWKTAVKVADDAIEDRIWLTSVGSASHYHADYVWPRWRRKMRRMTKIGRHIFYRTRKGGWS